MRRKRSRKLPAIAVLALALATAACLQEDRAAAPSPSADAEESEPAESGAPLRGPRSPVPLLPAPGNGEAAEAAAGRRVEPADAIEPVEDEALAETAVDVNGDGEEERLVVRMTRGKKWEETEPGPFAGPVRKGDVRLELWDAEGSLLHARDVNADFGGQPLLFDERRSFTLWVDDYNSDGRPEFALGQYFASNWFTYNLYEVSADGFRLQLAGLLSSPDGFSKWFARIGTRAFEVDYYNMKTGHYERDTYIWRDGRYVRAADPALACGDCRRWEDVWPGATCIPTEDGFVLVADEDAHAMYLHVSPRISGRSYIVHEWFRHESADGGGGRIFNSVAVMDAATGEVNLIPLYQADVDNVHQASSIAHGQGFLPDGRWVYVSVAQDGETGARYQLNKLDPATGETAVLVPELPGAEERYHDTSWLTEDGTAFVLLGNETGRMWVIDLADGGTTLLDTRFSLGWPPVFVHPSPDGRRFWHEDHERGEFRYYDLAGNELAAFPFTTGMDSHPAVRWSHDGRFVVYSDTFDRDAGHVMDAGGDFERIAPQRLAFRDRNGDLVHTLETSENGVYVELAGWPAAGGDTVLVERYRLADDPDMAGIRRKTDRRFALLDVRTGKETGLRQTPGAVPERVTDAFYLNRYGPIALADRESGELVQWEHTVRLAETDDDTLAWILTDAGAWSNRLCLWDAANSRLIAYDIPMMNEDVAVAGQWWYTTGKAAHRLPPAPGSP